MEKLTRREREQLEREEIIVSKAEELFCEKGFEKVSMDDLAKASEFTKRTLYRYFTCKEDLFFAVSLRGNERLFNMIKASSKKGATGFDKIRLSYYAYYEFFCKFPRLLQLMNMGGVVKSSSRDKKMPFKQKCMDVDKHLFEELTQMFHTGKSDGSIRSDLDITKLAFSSIFVAAGFFQMISLSGNTYTQHFSLDKEDFIRFTLDMLVDSLRNK